MGGRKSIRVNAYRAEKKDNQSKAEKITQCERDFENKNRDLKKANANAR